MAHGAEKPKESRSQRSQRDNVATSTEADSSTAAAVASIRCCSGLDEIESMKEYNRMKQVQLVSTAEQKR
jgi:hypothetical protein